MNGSKNTTEIPTKTIMNPEEAAEYLRISKYYLMEQYREGKIPGTKLGYRTVRFHRDELDKLIKEQ